VRDQLTRGGGAHVGREHGAFELCNGGVVNLLAKAEEAQARRDLIAGFGKCLFKAIEETHGDRRKIENSRKPKKSRRKAGFTSCYCQSSSCGAETDAAAGDMFL